MPPFFFWDLRSSLLSLFWVLFQVDCLSPLHLIVLIGFRFLGTSLVAQMVKCLSIMRETWVRSLGQEDPLEKEMAIHSSTIAWKIPWTEEPGRLQSMGSQRVGHDWATSHTHCQWMLSAKMDRYQTISASCLISIIFISRITLADTSNLHLQIYFRPLSPAHCPQRLILLQVLINQQGAQKGGQKKPS